MMKVPTGPASARPGLAATRALLVVCSFLVAGLLGPARAAGVAPPPTGARLPPGLVAAATPSSPVMALTFDDGPSAYTPLILSILQRFHIPATFFVVGEWVNVFPQYVRAEVRAGEEIGDHTWDHRDLQSLSTPNVVTELVRQSSAVRRVAGVTPHWFRPPYGDVDSRVIAIADSLGLKTVTWSIDPSDYQLPGVPAIVQNVLTYAQPGSIVIMHDGGGDRSETVAALPIIIKKLRALGYRFGTLDELFGLTPLPPCVPGAGRIFATAGVQPYPSHTIYRAWADLLCRGTNLGPATSPEFVARSHRLSQDFRRTGHRLEVLGTGQVKVLIEWSWAAEAFAARGVVPKYGRPITHSWFARFLAGVDWGPALKPQKHEGLYLAQQFQDGWAVESPTGAVHWRNSVDLKQLASIFG